MAAGDADNIVYTSLNVSRTINHRDESALSTHVGSLSWLQSNDKESYWYTPVLAMHDLVALDSSLKAGDMMTYRELVKMLGFIIGFDSIITEGRYREATLEECYDANFCRSRGSSGEPNKFSFSPMSRAEEAALALRAFGREDELTGASIVVPPFPDVGLNLWYTEVIAVAKRFNLLKGYDAGVDAGNFVPGREINFAETATILYRLLTEKMEDFQVVLKDPNDIDQIERLREIPRADRAVDWCFSNRLDAGLVWRTVTEKPGTLGFIVRGSVGPQDGMFCVTLDQAR